MNFEQLTNLIELTCYVLIIFSSLFISRDFLFPFLKWLWKMLGLGIGRLLIWLTPGEEYEDDYEDTDTTASLQRRTEWHKRWLSEFDVRIDKLQNKLNDINTRLLKLESENPILSIVKVRVYHDGKFKSWNAPEAFIQSISDVPISLNDRPTFVNSLQYVESLGFTGVTKVCYMDKVGHEILVHEIRHPQPKVEIPIFKHKTSTRKTAKRKK